MTYFCKFTKRLICIYILVFILFFNFNTDDNLKNYISISQISGTRTLEIIKIQGLVFHVTSNIPHYHYYHYRYRYYYYL